MGFLGRGEMGLWFSVEISLDFCWFWFEFLLIMGQFCVWIIRYCNGSCGGGGGIWVVLGCGDCGGGGWVVGEGFCEKQRKTTTAVAGVSGGVMFRHGSYRKIMRWERENWEDWKLELSDKMRKKERWKWRNYKFLGRVILSSKKFTLFYNCSVLNKN